VEIRNSKPTPSSMNEAGYFSGNQSLSQYPYPLAKSENKNILPNPNDRISASNLLNMINANKNNIASNRQINQVSAREPILKSTKKRKSETNVKKNSVSPNSIKNPNNIIR